MTRVNDREEKKFNVKKSEVKKHHKVSEEENKMYYRNRSKIH